MNLNEVMELYAVGVGCGLILSVIPHVIGSVVRFALDLIRKGGL